MARRSCGRNPGGENGYGSASYVDDTREMQHPFEIHAEITRDRSKMIAASRSDVAKAIAKRWIGPH